MASAAIWLEELGIPPREVCLDWAWQIQTKFANTSALLDNETTSLGWQLIEVSDSGELVLPHDFQKYSADERLQELLSWAQEKTTSTSTLESSGPTSGSQAPIPNERDVESALRQLTDVCVTGFVGNSVQSVMVSQAATLRAVSKAGVETCELWAQPSQSARQRARVASSNTNRTNQVIFALKKHGIVASIAVILVGVGCFMALNTGTGKSEKSSKPVALPRETASIASRAEGLASDKTADEVSKGLDEAESLDTLTAMPQFGEIEPAVVDIPEITMPKVSSSMFAGSDNKRSENAESADVGSSQALSEARPDEQESTGMRGTIESSNASELAERDVIQELEVLAKSAASDAAETDLAVPDVEDSSAAPEPLMLLTSPMIQTQKLAAKIKVRPRQPVWQILLSVDDEFELTPNDWQSISDRQITTWLLSNSDSASPMVRLVIQVQAAPGRQTTLRWRIFAGAEDMPDLMLPLDKEVLQPLQDRLRLYAQMTQREADRLRQVASVADRDSRAAHAKQRANLESQSKLASRLSTIVAETLLLDDLLRSQLTVYAKLRDGIGSDAPTVLQYGNPSALEKHAD